MEAAQRYLQQPVYTLDLQTDGRGTLEFGLVDHSKHKGALIEAKVDNTTSSWTVDSITLSAGKAKITQSMLFGMLPTEKFENRDMIKLTKSARTDTGGGDTMWADTDFVTAYWKQVGGSSKYGDYTWLFPCGSKLPDMQVSIGSSGSATIPGDAFKGAPVGGGEFFFLPFFLSPLPLPPLESWLIITH